MNGTAARFLRLGLGLSGLVFAGSMLTAQTAKPAAHGIPLPTDWSHSHLIFTNPGSRTGSGTQAARVSADPRYQQQIHRRNDRFALPPSEAAAAKVVAATKGREHSRKFKRDWAEDLGTGGTVGAGNYPAKFVFRSDTANCGDVAAPDYVVYSTGLASSPTQASIVGFDNLYSGCPVGDIPTIFWAYDTTAAGTPGTVRTSPALSDDGSQIAFVQTDGAGAATLVLLKWSASATATVATPVAPTLSTNAAYRACAAPCMTTFALHNLGVFTDDITSSVFYDFSDDTGWVGDSRGFLHKFTGIFKATPAEATLPWPVHLNPGNPLPLTSAIHDYASGKVFVEDRGGFLYSVDSSTGAFVQSAQLDFGFGFVQGPIVDSSNDFVYVFSSSDGTGAGGTDTCRPNACTAVYQLPVNFIAGATGQQEQVGSSTIAPAIPNPFHIGAFDSNYYNSTDATGSLYVCGDTWGPATLYQIPISAGAFTAIFGLGIKVTQLTAGEVAPPWAPCSSVTDLYNPNAAGGPTEHLFVSVQSAGISDACGGFGCLMNLVDTPWQPSTTYTVGQEILSFDLLHIEVVTTAGTSGALMPIWTSTSGAITTDGTVTWLDQGALTASTTPSWAFNTTYALPTTLALDSNGNIEISTTPGISGATPPVWSTVPGTTTVDGTVVWTNAGRVTTFGLGVSGGTGGIIVDNTVGDVTLLGASQIYFNTLADQPCGRNRHRGLCNTSIAAGVTISGKQCRNEVQ